MAGKQEVVRKLPPLSKTTKPTLWVLCPLGWEPWKFGALNTDLNVTCGWWWFNHEVELLRKWNHKFFVEWN